MAHIDDDQLELFALGRVETTVGRYIEHHVQRCSLCAKRLLEARSYVQAMREGLRNLEEDPTGNSSD